jgi:hypothetical protein
MLAAGRAPRADTKLETRADLLGAGSSRGQGSPYPIFRVWLGRQANGRGYTGYLIQPGPSLTIRMPDVAP